MEVTTLAKQVLSDSYGVKATEVRRLHAGMSTVNLVASLAGGTRLFVKVYRPGADLSAAEAAIGVTRYATRLACPQPCRCAMQAARRFTPARVPSCRCGRSSTQSPSSAALPGRQGTASAVHSVQ